MRTIIILGILVLFLVGCSADIHSIVSGTQELLLDDRDIQQIGMKMKGEGCKTEEYETNERSPLAEYSFCEYIIENEDTEVVIELKRFTNQKELDGAYQYSSLHLYSAEGLISEDIYGDRSRFRVNSEHDYGGELNDPEIYYYHLWICKDLYLIHVTSKGSEEAKSYISEMGEKILMKFE